MSGLPTPVSKVLREDTDGAGLERVWKGIRRRRAEHARRVPRVRWIGSVALTFLLVMLAWRGRSASPVGRADPGDRGALVLVGGRELSSLVASETDDREVDLSDGSRITMGAGAEIEPLENSPSAFSALVQRGRATFDVKPGGPRRWVLECGLATVEVVGTRFTVERAARSLRVSVEHGIVLVRGERVRDRVQRLIAGQSLEVDDDSASGEDPAAKPKEHPELATASPPPLRALSSMATAAPRALVAPSREWQGLERSGDHAAAYEKLGPAGIASASTNASVDDLLALADVARLSGHPADAVIPLERVLAEHADDPKAPLAAFTLGRLQLDALGHPALASDAFARALALGLPQSLQEDACARLVEARARAGDAVGANAAAQEYEHRFPSGQRLGEVRRWTGVP